MQPLNLQDWLSFSVPVAFLFTMPSIITLLSSEQGERALLAEGQRLAVKKPNSKMEHAQYIFVQYCILYQ